MREIDPISVETQVCGLIVKKGYGLGGEPASDTKSVGCSVACLEWYGWKK